MKKETISKLRKIIREEYKKLNENVHPNSEFKLKVRSEGKYKVTWTDRDYKKHEKIFKDDPNGAPENGLIKAKQFKADLEKKDKQSTHGLYRSIDLSIIESKLKKESITGEVIFSVQAKDNSVVKVTELPNGVIYVYKDGQKTNWKAVQGLVNPKDRKEIGDYILKGEVIVKEEYSDIEKYMLTVKKFLQRKPDTSQSFAYKLISKNKKFIRNSFDRGMDPESVADLIDRNSYSTSDLNN